MNVVHLKAINNITLKGISHMKIESVLDESIELDEFINLGLTKKQRMMKQANKAAKGSINSEIDQMEVELLTYMRNSGEKYATPSIVKNYLKKKGLGKVGDQIVDQVASQPSMGANLAGLGKKAASAAAGAASGIAAAARSGDAPPNPRPTGPQSAPSSSATAASAPTDKPQASPAAAPSPENKPLPKGTVASLGNGEEFEWLGAQWRSKKTGKMASKDQKAELTKNATAQTNSLRESEEAVLSKRQIKSILTKVIQKAYGQSAGFKRSSFATDNDGPDIQGMIDTLQSMGYKVTK